MKIKIHSHPIKALIVFATLGMLFASAASAEDINRAFLPLVQPLPEEMSAPGNELSDAKIDLGRMLYVEPRLSINGRIPWRVLDGGIELEDAVKEGKTVGMKNPDYEAKARDYIKRRQSQS